MTQSIQMIITVTAVDFKSTYRNNHGATVMFTAYQQCMTG